MQKTILGASVALLLVSQPAASQTLGTGHKPNGVSIGTGQARHTGGAGPSRYTALGGHAGFGIIPAALAIGPGLARPPAIAVPSRFPATTGGVALGNHAAVPVAPL